MYIYTHKYRTIYQDPQNLEKPEILLVRKYTCGTVYLFYTCTGILRRILNRLIQVRYTLLYKYINLYLLKTASLFTFQSLFYILSTIFSPYPEIEKILKSGSLPVPTLMGIWSCTSICNIYGTLH